MSGGSKILILLDEESFHEGRVSNEAATLVYGVLLVVLKGKEREGSLVFESSECGVQRRVRCSIVTVVDGVSMIGDGSVRRS